MGKKNRNPRSSRVSECPECGGQMSVPPKKNGKEGTRSFVVLAECDDCGYFYYKSTRRQEQQLEEQ